jgi:SET domain
MSSSSSIAALNGRLMQHYAPYIEQNNDSDTPSSSITIRYLTAPPPGPGPGPTATFPRWWDAAWRKRNTTTTTRNKGKGVFAQRAFHANDVVWRERCFVGAQHSTSTVSGCKCCAHCMRFLGTLEEQTTRLYAPLAMDPAEVKAMSALKLPNKTQLKVGDDLEVPDAKVCQCSAMANVQSDSDAKLPDTMQCDAEYCSEECRRQAWSQNHRFLCVSELYQDAKMKDAAEALVLFKQHASVSNDIFMLAAKLVAQLCSRVDAWGSTMMTNDTLTPQDEAEALHFAFSPIAHIVNLPWWDVVQVPAEIENKDAFRNDLIKTCTESFHLLRSTLALDKREPVLAAFDRVFDIELYARIIGMFEMNNWAMVAQNPLSDYIDRYITAQENAATEAAAAGAVAVASTQIQDEDVSAVVKSELDAAFTALEPPIQNGWEILADSSEVVAEGTGLYVVGSCFNHSCEPNVALLKSDGDMDNMTTVLALRDIQPGDELCISYIDENEDYHVRQDMLADYQFVCACTKCVREAAELHGSDPTAHQLDKLDISVMQPVDEDEDEDEEE